MVDNLYYLSSSTTKKSFPLINNGGGATPRLLIEEITNPLWGEIIENLCSLLHLEQGWDGYSAGAVSEENIVFASTVLRSIISQDTPAPSIVPGSNRDLQIEWHTHNVEIELHIISPNNVNAWIVDSKTDQYGEELTLSTDYTRLLSSIQEMTDYADYSAAAAG